MIIEAFGVSKDVMEWLEDPRINEEVTRDVLVKRTKRSMNGEQALTTPVIKGAGVGDTKARIQARDEKMEFRLRMFVLAQKIRYQYEQGINIEDLMTKFNVSKSQINKISGKQEWYNIHWRGSKCPEKFEEKVKEIKEKDKTQEN